MKNKLGKTLKLSIVAVFSTFIFLLAASPVQAEIAATPDHVTLEGIFTTPSISGKTNSASYTQDGVITVTPNSNSVVGAIWSTENNKLDFTKDFYLSAYVNQGDGAYDSGDGMVFVIQATDKRYTPNWFTYQGSAMGALGKDDFSAANADYDSLGIRSSVGIEFDLYGNITSKNSDGYFDAGAGITDYRKQHIAYVWPGSLIGYQDTVEWIMQKKRNVNHFAMNTDFGVPAGATPAFLANGQWIKLEVKWTKDTRVLQYRVGVGNKDWVTIDATNLKNIVLNTTTNPNQTAYWGFTGATGPKFKAYQQVVFESVPGLVTADTSISGYRGEESIASGGLVAQGEEVTIAAKAAYNGGKQDWKSVITTVQLPQGVTYVSDSAYTLSSSGAKEMISGVVYDDTNQTVTFPAVSLSSSQPVYEPYFHVKIGDQALGTLNYTASFIGSNLMQDTETAYTQTVAVNSEGGVTINQADGTHLFDNEGGQIQFTGNWSDVAPPSETNLKYRAFVDDELLGDTDLTSTALSGTWSQAVDMSGKAYGEHSFKIQLMNQMSEVVDEKTVTFLYQSRPEVTLADTSDLTGAVGTKFTVAFSWLDKDSEAVSLYYQLNDGEPILLKENLENLECGTSYEENVTIDTKSGVAGENTLRIYATDSEGNKSVVSPIKITLTGTLHFVQTPADYGKDQSFSISESGKDLALSGTPVTVEDSRGDGATWQVQLRLAADFSDGNHTLENILYLKDEDGSLRLVSKDAMLLKEQQSQEGEEVTVAGNGGSSGFYIKFPQDAYRGSYNATLEWTLQDAL